MKTAKGDTTDTSNVGSYAFSYDSGTILIAIPYEWWLGVFACVALLGCCVSSTMRETWITTRKKARKSWRRAYEVECNLPIVADARPDPPDVAGARLVNSTTQTETTYRRNWTTPRFAPTSSLEHGAWIDAM